MLHIGEENKTILMFSDAFSKKDVQVLTGFPYEVVQKLAAEIAKVALVAIEEKDVVAALCMLHTNASDEVLAFMMRPLFPGKSEDCIRKRVKKNF